MRVEEKSDKLYNQLFSKWISGNDSKFTEWQSVKPIRGKMKEQITELLNNGFKVSTGYTASQIRGCHNYHIFYKT